MTTLHASAVAIGGRGLLILGPSGSGKSALALELMAMGAGLIADDRVCVTRRGDAVIADCPPALKGRIEARGLGILNAVPAGPTPLALVVDLGRDEPERLPPWRQTEVAGVTLPLALRGRGPHLGAALRQMLLCGRSD